MKQLLILSGKGGTGKTTIASAFIKLAHAKAFADCDVDAPNLHLIMLNDEISPKMTPYYGVPKASINQALCIQCDLCRINCHFDAIVVDQDYRVDPFSCEGCGVCILVCKESAITMEPEIAGELKLFKNHSVFSTATLKMGSGTSGKLVTEVKKQLLESKVDTDIAIIDGSPGIGCPVISSLSGVDMTLIVAEPSISGESDMIRIIKTAQIFHTKIGVCINKYDTNLHHTERIEQHCLSHNIPYFGRIPYDEEAVKAINSGKCITEVNGKAGAAVRDIFNKTMACILG